MRRAFTLAARRRGLLAAAAGHAVIATVFVTAWGDAARVPFLSGANLFEQLALVQMVFMAVAAPWIGARLASGETRTGIERLARHYGTTSTIHLRDRMAVASIWTLLVQLAALPAAIEAQQVAAVAPWTAIAWQLTVLAIGLTGAALASVLAARHDSGIVRWLAPAAALIVTLVVLA